MADSGTVGSTTDKFRWDRLTVASTLGYCLLIAGLSVGPVLGELREQFGISGFIAALHGSTFGIGLLAVGVWGVRIVERLGRRDALRVAAFGIGVGVVLFCAGPSWPVTLLGTVFSGFSGALLVMVMPGLINDHHGEHRAEAFAAVNGVPGVMGVAVSLAIGAALGLEWSWRAPYLVLTAVILGILAVVAWPVAVPTSAERSQFSLRMFRRREVMIPWLFIVNAVLTEFTIAIWSTTFLKEVGGASSGLAPALGGAFGIAMFAGRMYLPAVLRRFGDATISLGFLVLLVGVLVMALAPGLWPKVVGLVITGLGGAPLYPLTVDRLYHRAGATIDSVSLGAISAIASGAAVTLGPLALGVLSDSMGLRRAVFVVPALALLGAITQRPRTGATAAAIA